MVEVLDLEVFLHLHPRNFLHPLTLDLVLDQASGPVLDPVLDQASDLVLDQASGLVLDPVSVLVSIPV